MLFNGQYFQKNTNANDKPLKNQKNNCSLGINIMLEKRQITAANEDKNARLVINIKRVFSFWRLCSVIQSRKRIDG